MRRGALGGAAFGFALVVLISAWTFAAMQSAKPFLRGESLELGALITTAVGLPTTLVVFPFLGFVTRNPTGFPWVFVVLALGVMLNWAAIGLLLGALGSRARRKFHERSSPVSSAGT